MVNCQICYNKKRTIIKEFFDDRYGAHGRHDIHGCTKCGFGKTIPGLNHSEIGQFYADHYPLSQVTPKTLKSQVRLISPIRAWLEGVDNTTHWYARSGQNVLDIGSASGISLLEIQALGAKAYGVEPDPHGQKIAKALNLPVHQGFITDDPFPNMKFDLITASQVLEHEPDPLKFLRAIRLKLAPTGRVIMSFPNYDALYRHVFGRRWLHWHIPYHLNFFTRKSFALLAEQAGFKLIKIRTITPNLWTVLQLRSLLFTPEEGTPSPIWVQAQSPRSKSSQPSHSLLNRGLQLLARTAVWAVMPLNRLIDLVGLGESLLVILEPKGRS